MGTKTDVKHIGKTDILHDQWHELKGRLREEWAQLTDDDLAQMSGSQDELVAFLQLRYGYTGEQAAQEIQRWLRNQGMQPGVQMQNPR